MSICYPLKRDPNLCGVHFRPISICRCGEFGFGSLALLVALAALLKDGDSEWCAGYEQALEDQGRSR